MSNTLAVAQRRYNMNRRSHMQGGKNWILPKEINACKPFFCDSHRLEIWKNRPSIGPNGGSGRLWTQISSRLGRHFLLTMQLGKTRKRYCPCGYSFVLNPTGENALLRINTVAGSIGSIRDLQSMPPKQVYTYMNNLPTHRLPTHSIPLGSFRIFSKIRRDIRSSRFATGVNDTGGKWKKSSVRKILKILFGHLWVVEETYI